MTNMQKKPPAQLNIAEAKARFSELVRRALAGGEVVIAKDNRPILRLVPIDQRVPRKPGSARGKIRVAPDFDAPLEDFADHVK
jgi:prevent-host-death family protein